MVDYFDRKRSETIVVLIVLLLIILQIVLWQNIVDYGDYKSFTVTIKYLCYIIIPVSFILCMYYFISNNIAHKKNIIKYITLIYGTLSTYYIVIYSGFVIEFEGSIEHVVSVQKLLLAIVSYLLVYIAVFFDFISNNNYSRKHLIESMVNTFTQIIHLSIVFLMIMIIMYYFGTAVY